MVPYPLTVIAGQGGAAPAGGGGMGSEFIVVMLIIFAAFYLIILRPQRKEQQKREQLLNQLKKGDDVISAGGIHGKVVDTSKKDVVVVEVDSQRKTRLTFNRGSISVINPGKSAPAETTEEKDTADAKAGSQGQKKKK